MSRHLISWVNFLYFKLGSIPIWPSKEEILETMPTSFKKTYPNTRIVLSFTIFFEYPKLSIFKLQKSCYLKGLVGIAPSGAVIFVSQLYDGSISDKEIVNRSGFLKKELWSDGDSVMAGRGSTIHDELARVGVSLNIPSFLGGRAYLTKAEVKASQTIASVRIHIERTIQRIKTYTVSFKMKYH